MVYGNSPNFDGSDIRCRCADVDAALDGRGGVVVECGSEVPRFTSTSLPGVMGECRGAGRLLESLVLTSEPGCVVGAVAAILPWVESLPADDRLELVADIGCAAEMSRRIGSCRPLYDVLVDWRRTASAWADGFSLLGPLEVDAGPALRVEWPELC